MGIERSEVGYLPDVEDEEELDEEPGEVIESAPPLKVGEERELGSSGMKKKLLKRGVGYETPKYGDEVTVHYIATLIDGTKFGSTRDKDKRVTIKLGQAQLVSGLDNGILTMKKGECALFTLPPELAYGTDGHENVPPGSVVQFEVELLSWITVVEVCKDGGLIKKIIEKGERSDGPSELDEVLVRYRVELADGTIMAETPEEGIQFYIKDGHLCPALPKSILTMKRGEKATLIVQPKYAFGEEGTEAEKGICRVPPSATLNVDIELVSFNRVVDVIGDFKVFKKILKEGDGTAVADEGATVTVSYTARLEDGTIFERRGTEGEHPLVFVTDEEQVIVGLDRAAVTMKKGEKAILTINYEHGFGNAEMKRDLAVVPPFSNLLYDVEMLDFIKEKTPWEMHNQERIKSAARKKEEGNVLFKSGKYQTAMKKYEKATDYVEEGSFGDDERKQVKALKVSCWSNAAACSLKLKDFQGAIKLCSKVLEVEFHNVKALYRRAQALMESGDSVSAEMDVKKALEADPGNREAKSLQRTLKQLQAESNKRDARLYANMFARVTEDSPVPPKKQKVEKTERASSCEEAVEKEKGV